MAYVYEKSLDDTYFLWTLQKKLKIQERVRLVFPNDILVGQGLGYANHKRTFMEQCTINNLS